MKLFSQLQSTAFTDKTSAQDILLHILEPLIPFYSENCGLLRIGDTRTHYDKSSQEMEAFARPLWGLAALLSGLSQEEKNKVLARIRTAKASEALSGKAMEPQPDILHEVKAEGVQAPTSHCSFSDSRLDLITRLTYVYQRGIVSGTDPASPDYWGLCHDFDQKFCEMPAIGFAMLYAREFFLNPLTAKEKVRLADWLCECNRHNLCACNWQFFQIITNLALKVNGLPYSKENMETGLEMIDDYYAEGGWYNDGNGGDKDYYNPFVMLSFGLIYRDFMAEEDPERCRRFYERAMSFGKDFRLFFDDTGSCFPYGRSMTYRFAQSAFWSTCLMTHIYPIPASDMMALTARSLCRWLSRPIFDNAGILTIGYGYGNLQMSESYNAPGSPYWALQAFFYLALPDTDICWRNLHSAEDTVRSLDDLPDDRSSCGDSLQTPEASISSSEELLPSYGHTSQTDSSCCTLEHLSACEAHAPLHTPAFTTTLLPSVPMLLQRMHKKGFCDQVVALVPGKTNHEGHSHNIEKYSKFAYSSKFGFSIARSSVSLQENAPDSTLAFEIDGYIYTKNMTKPDYIIDEKHIVMNWSPVRGIEVTTTLYPTETGHIRDHLINVDELLYKDVTITAYDCGFSEPEIPDIKENSEMTPAAAGVLHPHDITSYQCMVTSLEGGGEDSILIPEPNTNLLYPSTRIPMSKYTVNCGQNHIKTDFRYL
ncbi:MAG: DUF2264 domain-containing protein [Oribacterium sp.]|nr:DUF2264 domain-containing protein [Oribacterium sp.]